MPQPQLKIATPPSRVHINQIIPNLDNGRFCARAVINREQEIKAVILCDGHDLLKADLLVRYEKEKSWRRMPMIFKGNDTYSCTFIPKALGTYYYTVEADIDDFATWQDGFLKKLDANEANPVDLEAGISLLKPYKIDNKISELKEFGLKNKESLKICLSDPSLLKITRESWDNAETVRYQPELPLSIDPEIAGFSAWYEFFPRSKWKDIAEDGTLKDAQKRLSYVADLGFNIVYLPPIHPIGKKNRKGPNNSLVSSANDPGSPWAIGNEDGGHKSIDPALGDFKDFDNLISTANKMSISLALDIAFQCSPDHPYVREHPEWFRKRADNTIQYAENPPKKYQDIYPFDFECDAWETLWTELKSVILFWAQKGVRVFRVDNPHTKAFPFWEWAIAEIRKVYPEAIFLAEAFTKPYVMAHLAKIGFSQSYTYFAWRYTKRELTEYLTQLNETELQYYFRPNFWPNTPDILAKDLQTGLASSYKQRLVLAATLSPNYGIYGPAFELMESTPVAQGKEEYKDSEKYQIREWDVKTSRLTDYIKQINKIRNQNPALQSQQGFMFHPIDNEEIIAYSKKNLDNVVLVVVNLDEHPTQSGILDFQIHQLGIPADIEYEVYDALNNERYKWKGWKNYIELSPQKAAHVFVVKWGKSDAA